MSDILFRVSDLTKTYYASNTRQVALSKQISFVLNKGETLGIVGESGCGKTTLLRVLSLLEKPDSGTIELSGEDVTHAQGVQRKAYFKNVQMIFQNPASAFFPRMSVQRALCEPLQGFTNLRGAQRNSRVDELLDMVSLSQSLKKRYPHELSGGQLQRLGIARALASNPQILLCDEITSALDVSVQDEIMVLLAQLQREKNLSLVFVTHDLPLAQACSHSILVMYEGAVVERCAAHDFESACTETYTKKLIDSTLYLEME